MGRVFGSLIGLCFIFIFSSSTASAYTPTIAPNGLLVRWPGQAKLNLAGNPNNSIGFGAGDFYSSVVRSLQRWQGASAGAASFDYWQGTNSGVYTPNSEYNGLSSIYFLSNTPNGQGGSNSHMSSNVLGLTQVWYNTENGQILEVDIVLNDRDFRFTTDPRDTSGYGSGSISLGGRNSVFIENVLTHEFGHAFGLSHAGGLQSTMLFMESPEQAHLSCDDEIAIHALYPTQDASVRGTLTGVVVGESGTPIFGAHVLAISRRRGTVLASAISDRSGRYVMNALEPGDYYLMAEPFYPGSQVLPAYYTGISYGICANGQPFGRSFLTQANGYQLLAVGVPAGGSGSAPTFTARCGSYGGAAVPGTSLSSNWSSAPVVLDGELNQKGFGVADRFTYSSALYYKMKAVSGHVEAHAMGYSLYSPMHPVVSLLDAYGNPVLARKEDRVYVGDSGYVNYDSVITADGLPSGDYYLQVSGSSLNASYYPAGPIMLDPIPFVVVTASINESAPSLAGALPVNARCRMDESFGGYSSPPGDPPRNDTSSSDQGVGFCGTINGSGSAGDGPGGGPSPGAIAGWLLPWLCMAGIWRWSRLQLA